MKCYPLQSGKQDEKLDSDDEDDEDKERDQRLQFTVHTSQTVTATVNIERSTRNLRKERIKQAWNIIRVASLTLFVIISMVR